MLLDKKARELGVNMAEPILYKMTNMMSEEKLLENANPISDIANIKRPNTIKGFFSLRSAKRPNGISKIAVTTAPLVNKMPTCVADKPMTCEPKSGKKADRIPIPDQQSDTITHCRIKRRMLTFGF